MPYKVSRYDLRDEAVAVFLGLWVLLLMFVFSHEALASKGRYDFLFWLFDIITVLTFILIAVLRIMRKIKNYKAHS